MKTLNVFVSSIITGFSQYRQATFQAIRDIDEEKYGCRLKILKVHSDDEAMPTTPQKACLSKVRASHIYIGIFGHKYGKINPKTGMSPVHEELNEAYRTGKDILIFLENCRKETRQEKLIRSIGNYQSGRKYSVWDDSSDLKYKIFRSLASLLLSKKNKHESGNKYDLLSSKKRYKQIKKDYLEYIQNIPTAKLRYFNTKELLKKSDINEVFIVEMVKLANRANRHRALFLIKPIGRASFPSLPGLSLEISNSLYRPELSNRSLSELWKTRKKFLNILKTISVIISIYSERTKKSHIWNGDKEIDVARDWGFMQRWKTLMLFGRLKPMMDDPINSALNLPLEVAISKVKDKRDLFQKLSAAFQEMEKCLPAARSIKKGFQLPFCQAVQGRDGKN